MSVLDLMGARPATTLFYEDISATPVASMKEFLAANGQSVDVADIVSAVQAKSNVKQLPRPDAHAQYEAMSRSLPGFRALYQLRNLDPLSQATYQEFSDHGYV